MTVDGRPLFLPLTQDVRGERNELHRVSIFCINDESPLFDPSAERELYDAIDRCVRTNDATVVIDVHLPQVPQLVVAVARRFASSGHPLIGVHRRQCSLDGDYTSSHEFFEACRRAAGRNGIVWHPIKLQFVQRNPLKSR
jgi:hypothetical protein